MHATHIFVYRHKRMIVPTAVNISDAGTVLRWRSELLQRRPLLLLSSIAMWFVDSLDQSQTRIRMVEDRYTNMGQIILLLCRCIVHCVVCVCVWCEKWRMSPISRQCHHVIFYSRLGMCARFYSDIALPVAAAHDRQRAGLARFWTSFNFYGIFVFCCFIFLHF